MSPVDRRSLLGSLVAGGIAATAAATMPTQARADQTAPESPTSASRPFYGDHQQTFLATDINQICAVGLDVTVSSARELADVFRTLTTVLSQAAAGGVSVPPAVGTATTESGTLGAEISPDRCGAVLSVGESLFDDRFGLAPHKPRHLTTMKPFADDALQDAWCHGDLSLLVSADHRDTVLHTVRRALQMTHGAVVPKWRLNAESASARPSGTPRNHFGFKDGIANPQVQRLEEATKLMWAASDEPAWAAGGTYQVIRLIRMLVEFWDRITITEQQEIFGRDKLEGAPLDGSSEHDIPNYANDPAGDVIPLTSHIRLANPRTADTDNQQVLRRAYNYDLGIDDAGNLDVGLLFTCYQQDIARQFDTIQTRLAGEPMADYVFPFGGGYFFTLPGVRDASDFLGRSLLQAAGAA